MKVIVRKTSSMEILEDTASYIVYGCRYSMAELLQYTEENKLHRQLLVDLYIDQNNKLRSCHTILNDDENL